MKIRYATHEDFPVLNNLLSAMHKESRFHIYPLSQPKLSGCLDRFICNSNSQCILVAEHSQAGVVGVLAGYVIDYFFSDARMAQDQFFYVSPKYRGSPAAVKLLAAFRQWAVNRNASELCINMSVDIDRHRFEKFMTHLKFKSAGSNFYLPLIRVV
jgi:GNAT superfamily N-acetyltransferase